MRNSTGWKPLSEKRKRINNEPKELKHPFCFVPDYSTRLDSSHSSYSTHQSLPPSLDEKEICYLPDHTIATASDKPRNDKRHEEKKHLKLPFCFVPDQVRRLGSTYNSLSHSVSADDKEICYFPDHSIATDSDDPRKERTIDKKTVEVTFGLDPTSSKMLDWHLRNSAYYRSRRRCVPSWNEENFDGSTPISQANFLSSVLRHQRRLDGNRSRPRKSLGSYNKLMHLAGSIADSTKGLHITLSNPVHVRSELKLEMSSVPYLRRNKR